MCGGIVPGSNIGGARLGPAGLHSEADRSSLLRMGQFHAFDQWRRSARHAASDAAACAPSTAGDFVLVALDTDRLEKRTASAVASLDVHQSGRRDAPVG